MELNPVMSEIVGFVGLQEQQSLAALGLDVTVATGTNVNLTLVPDYINQLMKYPRNSIRELNISLLDVSDANLLEIVKRQRRLRKLVVFHNRITTLLPVQRYLRHLEYLNINRGDFTGIGIAALKRLYYVNVLNNRLIPAGITEITSLPYLETLLIQVMPDIDIRFASPHLYQLDISGVTDNQMPSIGQLKSLEYLNVRGSRQLSDNGISHLSNILTTLDIAGCEKVSNLSHLTQLRYLNAEETEVRDVSALVNLRGLVMSGNEDDPYIDVGQFTKLTRLRYLSLSKADLVNVMGLDQCKLRYLYLETTTTPEDSIMVINSMAHLTTLRLIECDYTPEDIARLHPPKLKRLELTPGQGHDYDKLIESVQIPLEWLVLTSDIDDDMIEALVGRDVIPSADRVEIDAMVPSLETYIGHQYDIDVSTRVYLSRWHHD